MPWRPRSPLTMTASPDLNRRRADRSLHVRFDQADAGGVDENAVSFSFVDDFRVAGDELHTGFGRSLLAWT